LSPSKVRRFDIQVRYVQCEGKGFEREETLSVEILSLPVAQS